MIHVAYPIPIYYSEGSSALFRVALTLFKMSENLIMSLKDSLEIFQVIQVMYKLWCNNVDPAWEGLFDTRAHWLTFIRHHPRVEHAKTDHWLPNVDGGEFSNEGGDLHGSLNLFFSLSIIEHFPETWIAYTRYARRSRKTTRNVSWSTTIRPYSNAFKITYIASMEA